MFLIFMLQNYTLTLPNNDSNKNFFSGDKYKNHLNVFLIKSQF